MLLNGLLHHSLDINTSIRSTHIYQDRCIYTHTHTCHTIPTNTRRIPRMRILRTQISNIYTHTHPNHTHTHPPAPIFTNTRHIQRLLILCTHRPHSVFHKTVSLCRPPPHPQRSRVIRRVVSRFFPHQESAAGNQNAK